LQKKGKGQNLSAEEGFTPETKGTGESPNVRRVEKNEEKGHLREGKEPHAALESDSQVQAFGPT